jgi:hypothetical protein
MICALGEEVTPTGTGFPNLYSIGQSLGRIPRFAGHTQIWYPVLAHTLTVAKLLPPQYAIYGLLHDAQEACMGDVPTPWKTKAAQRREEQLLSRIYYGHGLVWPISYEAQQQVDLADSTALAAEAHVLKHPAANQYWPEYSELAAKYTEEHLQICKDFLDPSIAGNLYKDEFEKYYQMFKDYNISG